jgi:hypothetical protein
LERSVISAMSLTSASLEDAMFLLCSQDEGRGKVAAGKECS